MTLTSHITPWLNGDSKHKHKTTGNKFQNYHLWHIGDHESGDQANKFIIFWLLITVKNVVKTFPSSRLTFVLMISSGDRSQCLFTWVISVKPTTRGLVTLGQLAWRNTRVTADKSSRDGLTVMPCELKNPMDHGLSCTDDGQLAYRDNSYASGRPSRVSNGIRMKSR